MTPSDLPETAIYRGHAVTSVDGRGRVTFPPFVRRISEDRFEIRSAYLTRHVSEPCLVGFGDPNLDEPYTRAEVLSIKEGGGPSPGSRRFATAEQFGWDSSGRVVLSRRLLEFARIEDKALFVAAGNLFEIWNPAIAAESKDEGLRSVAVDYLDDRGTRPDSTFSSASWTGHLSAADHARFARNLIPEAINALDQIIAVYDAKLGNSPPEPLDAEQLAALRQLHDALGALIKAVDSGRPLAEALAKVRKVSSGMWSIGKKSQRLLLQSSPALAASVPASFGLIMMLEFMLGYLEPIGRAGVAAAVTGGLLKFGATDSDRS